MGGVSGLEDGCSCYSPRRCSWGCLYEVVGEPLSPHSMSSHDMLGPRYEPHSSLTGGTKKES